RTPYAVGREHTSNPLFFFSHLPATILTSLLGGKQMWRSLAAVPLALSLFNPTFAIAQEAPANQKSLPEQTVDAFNGVFGVHPKARSNHAKGVLLEGTFTPSASAASVSKAAHLQKQKTPIPVTVRFS